MCTPFLWHDMKDALEDPKWHLMQFTGLLDSEGKEIYEGDILKRYYKNKDTEEWIYREVKISKYGWNLEDFAVSICTIVGNIYENNELLK